jgi:peptide-methionine (S)-S-oxide reductase
MTLCTLSSFLLGSIVLLSNPEDPEKMSQIESQGVSDLKDREVVTLGGGCFWCIEAIFDELKGVEEVESGYSGGQVENPTYKEVCTGTTGHAEVVQVTFDPEVIPLKDILKVFFTVHDPTTMNRQGPDVGPQYRSAVFYRNQEQQTTVEKVIQEIEEEKLWDSPIVTEVTPFEAFFKAEDYHQEYYKLNGKQPYCRLVIAPKIAKFRKEYKERLKQE